MGDRMRFFWCHGNKDIDSAECRVRCSNDLFPPVEFDSSLALRTAQYTGRWPVSAHTLRHTFALGYLRDNPGKLLELAGLLGHESLDTTAVYTRPSREDLAADLERSHLNVDG